MLDIFSGIVLENSITHTASIHQDIALSGVNHDLLWWAEPKFVSVQVLSWDYNEQIWFPVYKYLSKNASWLSLNESKFYHLLN